MMQLSNLQQITELLTPQPGVPTPLRHPRVVLVGTVQRGLLSFKHNAIGKQEGESRTPCGRTDTISFFYHLHNHHIASRH